MKAMMIVAAIASLTTQAYASDVKSVYTQIDLKKCKQTQKPDGQVFEGAWACKGMAGYDVFLTAADSRDMVSFGKAEANNCSGQKTFGSFNSAGATVEWRVKAGKPIAAILRWTVSIDPDDPKKQATWIVLNKLDKGTACQMHYVAGSFPNANDAARKAADEKAGGFNCENDTPTFDSKIGAPNINLESCSAEARE
jgi:hypothetical protein